MIKRLSIMKESDTKSYRDSVKNFDFGRSSHPKSSQESSRSFRDKRTQPNTSYNHFSARASRGGRGGKRKLLSRDKIAGFLAGMGKKSRISQSSKFTTAWLSSRLQNSTKIVKNSAHFERISQQKQRWRPPRSGSGHACKKGDNSCQKTHNSGILQQAISGIQTHETVETSDRFKYVKQPFTCTNIQNGNSRIYQEVDSKRGVGHLDRSNRRLFPCPNSSSISKYLRFQTKKGVFQFRALRFGVATAPLEFTRIVKEVKLIAHARNLRIHQYLDDWLLRSPTEEQCLKDSKSLVKLAQELGWLINFQKSELVPTQNLDFLGYHFDLQNAMVFPTQKKLDRLNIQTVSIRRSLVLTPRKLISLIGTLASLEKTVPLGRLHMRPFQWYLRSHWKFPQSLDKRIPVTGNFLNHLKWWESLQNLMAGAPIHPHIHNTLVFTDASQKGWGAHLNEIVLSGLWSNKEAQLHINVLELKAVLLALKGFQEHLQGHRVLICSDNSTVISYLNKEGGTHSIEMCALIWRILAFTNSRRIQIRARHVPGSLNVIADSLSRRDKVIQTEWSLHQQIFNQICRVWHTPMVDLFATHLNYKLPIYVSPVPDRKDWKIDALNICWEGLDGYVFCPVAILPQVIQKIITYPCRMIVLAPGWPGMPWFWDLVDLSTRVPLQLPHWKTLLKQPHSNRFHNNVEYLNLHVWLLDSRNPILEDSHLRWQKELRHLRGNPQEKSINQGGPFWVLTE